MNNAITWRDTMAQEFKLDTPMGTWPRPNRLQEINEICRVQISWEQAAASVTKADRARKTARINAIEQEAAKAVREWEVSVAALGELWGQRQRALNAVNFGDNKTWEDALNTPAAQEYYSTNGCHSFSADIFYEALAEIDAGHAARQAEYAREQAEYAAKQAGYDRARQLRSIHIAAARKAEAKQKADEEAGGFLLGGVVCLLIGLAFGSIPLLLLGAILFFFGLIGYA